MKNYLSINSLIPSFNKILNVPGDKSLSIRWVLLASQAIGKSKAYNLLESDDVISAIVSMRKLGVEILKRKSCYEINGVGLSGFRHNNNVNLDAGNSGTFARLLCGALAGNITNVKVTGDSSLSKRDFSRVVKPLELFGINIKTTRNKMPITVRGSKFLRPIFYKEEKGSCLLYTSPSPRDGLLSRMPSSA